MIANGLRFIKTNALCLYVVKSRLKVPDVYNILCYHLFSRQYALFKEDYGFPKLSPYQVSHILRAHEISVEVGEECSVKSFDSNMIGSNDPIEDRRAEAKCQYTTGMLFGVFDGHGGCACSQAVSERLFDYISVSLISPNQLEEIVKTIRENSVIDLLHRYKHENDYQHSGLQEIYRESLQSYIERTLNEPLPSGESFMKTALKYAFLQLDEALSNESLPQKDGTLNLESLASAISGACACIAEIDGVHLHIANVGDSRAVLGSKSENNRWVAKQLNREHNCDNGDEVNRIKSEHPENESSGIFKNSRLLGSLAPLRALGDFIFKWKTSLFKEIINPACGYNMILNGYYTPPYLTAEPEITHHRLSPRDKFIILASDGLWDLLSPEKAVKLVGEHMSGKRTLDPFYLPEEQSITIAQINELLRERQAGLANKPVDSNVATHLIRHALGSTEDGLEHSKLSSMLSLPENLTRYFRDDITVTVVFFNSDYIAECSH